MSLQQVLLPNLPFLSLPKSKHVRIYFNKTYLFFNLTQVLLTYPNLGRRQIQVLHSHLLQRSVMVLLRQEVNVPGCHYSNQFAAHFASFSHGDPRETVSYFCFKYIPHRVPWSHHHWVCNEALLEFLARSNSFESDTQTQNIFGTKKITSYADIPTLTLRTSLA